MAQFVNHLGDIVAESGRIPKGAFVRWAMQLLPVTVPSGNAEMLAGVGRSSCAIVVRNCCVLHGESFKRLGPPKNAQKTGNTYNQPNRPTTDTPHRPTTKHYREGSPGEA